VLTDLDPAALMTMKAGLALTLAPRSQKTHLTIFIGGATLGTSFSRAQRFKGNDCCSFLQQQIPK
jgi:hypothetical protein